MDSLIKSSEGNQDKLKTQLENLQESNECLYSLTENQMKNLEQVQNEKSDLMEKYAFLDDKYKKIKVLLKNT